MLIDHNQGRTATAKPFLRAGCAAADRRLNTGALFTVKRAWWGSGYAANGAIGVGGNMTELRFIAEARKIIDAIEQTQAENLDRAAEQYAETIASDGLVHLYGGGHSRMGVEETFPRIGSIVGFHPISELAITFYTNVVGPMGLRQALFLERVDGYGEAILQNYDFGPHDCLVVFSSTGINNVALDIALGGKQRGLPVVAITSVAHQMATESRHPSGKRLREVSDITIDNCTPPGDAMVMVDGCDYPVSPGSTVATATIVQTLNALAAERLIARGHKPLILGSPHFVGDPRAAQNLEDYYAETKRRFHKV
jgi:uncharacterized phosphosugar-binding protein